MNAARRNIPLLLLAILPALAAAPATAPTTAPATQPAAAATEAERLFTEGRDALFRRDYPKAIDLLGRAASKDPSRVSYRLHLARAMHYAGRTQEAQARLTEILKTAPDHIEAGLLLGEIAAAQENWKQVIAVLEPLLKYRHDYQIHHLLAEARMSLGEHDAARKHLEEAIKLNPQSAVDHYQLGNIYLAGNFFALAAESYQNALRLGLNSPVLHYKLGSAYFNLRNYFGSISTITVKSGQAGALSGEWYLIEPVPGQTDVFRAAPSTSAIYQVAHAIADGLGERPDLQFLRANIYLNAGRYAQAYSMYDRLRPSIPKEDQALFHYYFAQAAFGAGHYDRYLELLNEAIRLNKEAYAPTLVDAYIRVAEQYNQSGDLTKYIDYLSRAVDQSPQSAALHLKLGNAFQEAARPSDAAVQWQMVLDLEPDHPRRLDLLTLIANARRPPSTQPTTRPATQPATQPVR